MALLRSYSYERRHVVQFYCDFVKSKLHESKISMALTSSERALILLQDASRSATARPTGRAVGPPGDRLLQGDPRLRGDRAIEQGLGRPPVVPSQGHAVAPDDHQEGGRERGDDRAADPGRRGAGQLLPGAEGCRRLDAEERVLERRGRRHDGYWPDPIAELQRPFLPQCRH